MVRYSSHDLNSEINVWYSSHGLNSELLVRYSGHGLNTKLLPGIWITNKWKLVIQMFPLFICLLFRSPLYNLKCLGVHHYTERLRAQISNRGRYSICNINLNICQCICRQMLKTWSINLFLFLQCCGKIDAFKVYSLSFNFVDLNWPEEKSTYPLLHICGWD